MTLRCGRLRIDVDVSESLPVRHVDQQSIKKINPNKYVKIPHHIIQYHTILSVQSLREEVVCVPCKKLESVDLLAVQCCDRVVNKIG